MVPGETKREKMVRNNWQMWGDKGLLATHIGVRGGCCAGDTAHSIA
jgi:hypothetical protein